MLRMDIRFVKGPSASVLKRKGPGKGALRTNVRLDYVANYQIRKNKNTGSSACAQQLA
jgi:hypothetical protein